MHYLIAPHLTIAIIYRKFNVLQTGITIALPGIKKAFGKYFKTPEATMKKLAMMFEDLWVAVAFAEEGIYETSALFEQRPRIVEPVRIHVA